MRTGVALAVWLVATGHASAQVADIEVPTLMLESSFEVAGKDEDGELDLANIVQSAAKGITTIQEAPAIVTVVTGDEIRTRQLQDVLQLADTVPGWQRVGVLHSYFPTVTVRGQIQAVQFLQDGLSMFDSTTNMPTITRQQPMELVKRVEMITGPGGVLWGSNSLLGIMNLITKEAEDVEGVEVGSSIGHGIGDRLMARAYALTGTSKLLGGKLAFLGHGSAETYQGAAFNMPLLLFHQPLPQPNSRNTYGPLTETTQERSLIVNLSGKIRFGKLQLRAVFPFGRMVKPMGLSGNPGVKDLVEDARCENNGAVDPTCIDNLRASRRSEWDAFDRYVVAEYRDRFADGKAGITLRGYAQHFVRRLFPLTVLAPSSTIQGGLSFTADVSNYRVGAAFDADVEPAKTLRVLYGAEAFTEWLPDTGGASLQGPGTATTFQSPYDLQRLPLPCPRTYDANGAIVAVPACPLTFAFESRRSVIGAYINPQLRPNKKLILDAGARMQVAPERLGTIGYDLRVTAASSIVWNFIPNWHVKLNYAQGFRPPVFNNTSSNGEAVQIGGNPELQVETSDAFQAELNARIFKGERSLREVSLRLDGSYTRLTNLIQVNSGAYNNTGDRGISSAEFLGKAYLAGGHRLELAYTWLRVATADRGLIKSLPEHWFNFSTVFNLISNKLSATTNLKIAGAAEDPNRLVEYRGSRYDADGRVMDPVNVVATDVVLDLLPPIADLSAGITWTPMRKLLVRATVYNALLQHSYQPDVNFDYEPHLEYLPNPYEGIRAYLSMMFQY
jgi:outer membrane receptor protein involved in Fe transport